MCDEEEILDIGQQLDELLTKVQPNLQDVIKRSFTNVALQLSKRNEPIIPEILEETTCFGKNTQINLSKLELLKAPSFHVQSLSLNLKSMCLNLRCSLGEVNVKGVYCAFNENMYNLIPVMSEGHLLISLTNVMADVNVGLTLKDDAFSLVNPRIDFTHDEVEIKLSWPSPNKKTAGYDFTTTEQSAKHIDDLPISAAISLQLHSLLRNKLLRHLSLVLRRAISVSEVMCCNPRLLEAYSEMTRSLHETGNRVVDLLLINVRRMLLQGRREVLELPRLHAVFLHKVGTVSSLGRFETDVIWIKNLATVNRINDVSVVQRDPCRTSFHVTLAIKDLQVGFEYYVRGAGGGSGGGGRVVAAFAHSRLHLAVTVAGDGHANDNGATLDHLTLDHMDGMDVHATGAGAGAGAGAGGAGGALRAWLRGCGAGPALLTHLTHELTDALQQANTTQ